MKLKEKEKYVKVKEMKLENFDKTKTYILACSGGPDSMALFHILYVNQFHFSVCFVNYHKRKESDAEEEMVKTYAKNKNIPFYSLSAPRKVNKENFQSWARKVRYEFFLDVYRQIHADGLFIAHQKDDLLETYLFQKKRKGIYHYYGLKEESTYQDMVVYRPLLNYRKEELKQYCIVHQIPFSIDSSNLEDTYDRNKIRHHVIEKMTKEEILSLENEIKEANKENNELFLLSDSFLKDPPYSILKFQNLKDGVKKRCIYELLKSQGILNPRLIFNIMEFLTANKENGEMELMDSYKIIKTYGKFYLVKEENEIYNYKVNPIENLDTKYFYFDLCDNPSLFYIKEDSYPLLITNAYLEKTIKIGKIEKKMNRFFVDEKIPLYLRKIWPMIKDQRGKILFVPRKNILYNKEKSKIIFQMK